jgi:protein TonB
VLGAGTLSCGLHVLALAAVGLGLRGWNGPRPGRALAVAGWALPGLEPEQTFVDLTPADLVDPTLVQPAPAPASALPEADTARPAAAAAAISAGLPRPTAALAPDRGAGEGRLLSPAWRRDVSTTRARLTDGATIYQPSHERTSAGASSPQAARRERVIGRGDSARTREPRPPSPAAVLPAEPERSEDDQTALALEESPISDGQGRDPGRGQGPLDADRGPRAFDVVAPGPARDDTSARQASNEPRPGLADFTAAAASGPRDGVAGQGRAPAPGATRRESAASAPSPSGSPQASAPAEVGDGLSERAYAREHLEIRRRVAGVLRFPRRLALALEQGEAIVQFLVQTDGRVAGEVKLLKSAGFDEFDQEALAAVRRAAPFPSLKRPLLVRLRIPFQNPVIQ